MSSQVVRNIEAIFNKKIAACYALAKQLAEKALQELQEEQRGDEFWNNQTSQALDRLFSDAFQDADSVGFFLAHGVEYGVYLELANDRQNEALRPKIEKYALIYKYGVQEIMEGR